MKNNFLLALLGFLFLAVSCSKTIEGESQKWVDNQKRLQDLGAKYPNLKPAFDALLSDASKQMETAKSLGEEKSKIKAMAAANDIAAPNFVVDLANFDSKINNIRDLAIKAAQQSGDSNDKDAARAASRSADQTIEEAKSALASARATSPSDANAVVSSIISNLNAAENRLSEVVRNAESKKEDAKKAEEEAKTAEDNKKAEEEKKTQPIKCGYCGVSSPAGSTKCSACGADLTKK